MDVVHDFTWLNDTVYNFLEHYLRPFLGSEIITTAMYVAVVNPLSQLFYLAANLIRCVVYKGKAGWAELCMGLIWLIVVGVVWMAGLYRQDKGTTMLFFWTFTAMIPNALVVYKMFKRKPATIPVSTTTIESTSNATSA